MARKTQQEPTPGQLDALRQYAKENGRCWKARLLDDWLTGRDAKQENGGYLRQVRNQFGPRWLESFKLAA